MTGDQGGELTAGVRPAPAEEGRPQEKVQRHAGIGYEIVQNLDVAVLQMVEQLPNVLRFFLARWPVGFREGLGLCCPRAGYRRAQELTRQDSAALG